MAHVEKSREIKFKWNDAGVLSYTHITTSVDEADIEHIEREKDKYEFAQETGDEKEDAEINKANELSKRALLERVKIFLGL